MSNMNESSVQFLPSAATLVGPRRSAASVVAELSTDTAWPRLVGPDDYGGAFAPDLRDQVNLDYAATTPALKAASHAGLRLLPSYCTVHRGGAGRSRITTDAYEEA